MKTNTINASSKPEKYSSTQKRAKTSSKKTKTYKMRFLKSFEILIFSPKEEYYDLELWNLYKSKGIRRYSTTLLMRNVFWKL